jgi:hypothetical protein
VFERFNFEVLLWNYKQRKENAFLFLFPLVKYVKNVSLHACMSRTFLDVFVKLFACNECAVRMWVAVCQKCLTVQLATVSQAVVHGTSYSTCFFTVYFFVCFTGIFCSINIPVCV